MKYQTLITIEQAGDPATLCIATRIIRYITGVIWCDISPVGDAVAVTYDDTKIRLHEIIDRIRGAGFVCSLFHAQAGAATEFPEVLVKAA
jgi:hypothetical protein